MENREHRINCADNGGRFSFVISHEFDGTFFRVNINKCLFCDAELKIFELNGNCWIEESASIPEHLIRSFDYG